MKHISGLIFLFCLCLSLYAGGPRLSVQGQRQQGMAHTGTGLALDASSLFFNPAACSFVHRSQLMLGSTIVWPKASFLGRFPSFYTTKTNPQSNTPVYFYALWGTKEDHKWSRLKLGLAINNPFQTSTVWPDDWIGNLIIQEFNLSAFTIQPSLSLKLTDYLSLGGGFSLGVGNLLIRKALPENGPDDSQASLEYSGSGYGTGYNLGLFFKPKASYSLGISYRSSMEMKVEQGEARFQVPASLLAVYPNTRFQTTIRLPAVWNIGLGLFPRERLMLAFDVNLTQWSSFDTTFFDFEEEIHQVQDTALARNFSNSLAFRMGGEYTFSEYLQVRMGLHFEQTPVPDGWLSPAIPDANRIGLSLGIGTQISPNLSLDLSYLYEYAGERTSAYWAGGFAGTYLIYAFHLGIGMSYRF